MKRKFSVVIAVVFVIVIVLGATHDRGGWWSCGVERVGA